MDINQIIGLGLIFQNTYDLVHQRSGSFTDNSSINTKRIRRHRGQSSVVHKSIKSVRRMSCGKAGREPKPQARRRPVLAFIYLHYKTGV